MIMLARLVADGEVSMRIGTSECAERQPLSEQSHEHIAAELKELRATLDKLGQRFATHTVHVSSKNVHSLITARAVRHQLFEAGLFSDPAWDMLLHLYAQELDHQRVAVSKLCEASGVPMATALRHMKGLERRGLINRRQDDMDARRSWVELSSAGSAAMLRYFQWLSTAA